MRYISMFSGIEAATVAWHPLGWEAIAFAEIEKFPSAVLADRWPAVPNVGDMTKHDWGQYRGRCDLVVGGPPCQAFSVAGLRESLNDHRGNLSLEFMRAIHAIRPTWFVVENVPGWLNTEDNAFGCAIAGLVGADAPLVSTVEGGGWPSAGVASGPVYGLAWRVLDAQFFGVPQRRSRVFIVGHLGGWRPAASVLLEPKGLYGDPTPRRAPRKGITPSPQSGAGGGDPISIDRGAFNSGKTFESYPPIRESGPVGTLQGSGPGAVGAPVPILEVDGRRGEPADPKRAGSGIGQPGDPMFTLQAGKDHGVAVDLTGNEQFKCKECGDVFTDKHASGIGGLAPAECPSCGNEDGIEIIAFGGKDSGQDALINVSPTLRAGCNTDSNANAGVPPAVAIPFDTTQVTSKKNYSDPQPGDPSHPLAAGAHPPAIAIRTEASGANGTPFSAVSKTLDTGSPPAVGIPDPAYAIAAGDGGSKFGSGRERQDTFVVKAEPEGLQKVTGALQASGKAEGSATQQDAECGLLIPDVKTFDMRGVGDGKTVNTLAGEHAGGITDYTPIILSTEQDPKINTGIAPTLKQPSPTGGGQVPVVFKPCHYTRGKDGEPSEVHPPLTAEQDKGDTEPVLFSLMPQNSGKDFKAREVEVAQPLLTAPGSGDQGGDVVVFQQNSRSEVRSLGDKTGSVTAQPGAQQQNYVAEKPKVFEPRVARNGRGAPEDLCPPLKAQSGETGKDDSAPCVTGPMMSVRRLVPRECERLQGFPDDYSKIPWRGKPREDCPDGPRYRALGNSMCAGYDEEHPGVMQWIGKRIKMVAELVASGGKL